MAPCKLETSFEFGSLKHILETYCSFETVVFNQEYTVSCIQYGNIK